MDPLVALTTFAVVFPAELPDKSMFAAMVLGARRHPFAVWIGLAAAFLTHVVIAVTAGHLISALPKEPVGAGVTAFFFFGGLYLLLSSGRTQSDENEIRAAKPTSSVRSALAAYAVVFATEWGDLTQITTLNLAARYEDPFAVALGAVLALWTVSGLAVSLGDRLVRIVPMKMVKRAAGMALICLSVWSLVDLAHELG